MTPFHYIGDFLRELLLLVPLGAARALFVLTLLTLLVWVLRLPPRETTEPTGDGGGRNLKPWAALALLVQVVLYALL